MMMNSRNEEKCDTEEKVGGWEHINFDEIDLGDRIGGGGVGIVYNGWFRGRSVALKTLFDNRIGEDLKREYMDELLVMSKVKHSNIVSFLGACMTPPNLCFVMEMCECSLYQLLHIDRANFSKKECVIMATDIASAMEYLHAQIPTIIHRDLKSHNVLRASNGSLKICDFGLVMIKNTTAGTPAYMAPELIENR
jgi:serine/threonine protein kinase